MSEHTEHQFPEATYHDLLGLRDDKDLLFADQVVSALQKIDRGLLPPAAAHPLGHLIAQGQAALPRLLDLVEAGTDREQLDAMDAMAHILLNEPMPASLLPRLRHQLELDQTPERLALVTKCLAIGRDQAFLLKQVRLLADPDPGVVATAARLLGLGRFTPALPVLTELVSPERVYESRYVIWALGEMGRREALPVLEFSLGNAFRIVDCVIALGKIGDLTSIPRITPILLEGLPDQRDAGYRALAMILDLHRDVVPAIPDLGKELGGLIKAQFADDTLALSGSTRFHMCLCLARLGLKLDAGTVRRYLKIELEDGEAGGMASYFMRRKGKK
ncbi:MAG: HEAT repeat domain-containing protein [Pseudomonadota bacterium]